MQNQYQSSFVYLEGGGGVVVVSVCHVVAHLQNNAQSKVLISMKILQRARCTQAIRSGLSIQGIQQFTISKRF